MPIYGIVITLVDKNDMQGLVRRKIYDAILSRPHTSQVSKSLQLLGTRMEHILSQSCDLRGQ